MRARQVIRTCGGSSAGVATRGKALQRGASKCARHGPLASFSRMAVTRCGLRHTCEYCNCLDVFIGARHLSPLSRTGSVKLGSASSVSARAVSPLPLHVARLRNRLLDSL